MKSSGEENCGTISMYDFPMFILFTGVFLFGASGL